MRVPDRRISNDSKIKKTTDLSPKSKLKLGKKFTATVLTIDGEHVSLEINGKIIQAKNRSNHNLLMGSDVQFEVLKSSEEVIEIRAIPLSEFSSSENDLKYIKTNLAKLGLNFTDDNANVLSQILKMGIPLSKSNFMDIKQDVLNVQKLFHVLFNDGGEVNFQKLESADLSKAELNALTNLLSLDAKEVIGNKVALNALKDFISNSFQSISLSEASKRSVVNFSNSEENQNAIISNKSGSEDLTLQGEKKQGDLIKGFLSLFKDVAGQKDALIKQTVFLNKMGIKASIFNISTSDAILNGKLAFSVSLAEVLSKGMKNPDSLFNKDLEKVINNFFKSSLSISDFSETIDGKIIKEGIKNFTLVNDSLSNLDLETVGAEDVEKMGLLKQHATLIKEMDDTWQTVFMPMVHQSDIDEVELYIKKNGTSSKSNSGEDKKLIYLSLKTDNIERVKSRIEYSRKDLKIIFILENDDLREHAESQVSLLESKLSRLSDKKIHISFNSDQSDINLLDFELVTSFKPSSKIDIRV